MLNAHSAYAKVLRPNVSPRQYSITDTVLRDDAVAEEFRRELTAPYHAAKRGSRLHAPKLSVLIKNIDHGVNHLPQNVVTLALGAYSLGGIEAARRPWRIIDEMLTAKAPVPTYSLDDLQQIETEIEGICNNLQMRYMRGDRTRKLLLDMLEKFERIHEISGQIVAQLRARLYGGPRK